MTRIAIIGAGLAGLTVANRLRSHADVSVFDKSRGSGGRIATLLYFRLVQGPGPEFLSFVNYLVPTWAVLAGALFLDETLSAPDFVALGLILSGIAVSELAPRSWRYWGSPQAAAR